MSYVFKRAIYPILGILLTTIFAMVSIGFSPLMPISALGIFTSIIITINCILILLFIPSIIIIYEIYFKTRETTIKNAFLDMMFFRYWRISITAPKIDIECNISKDLHNFGESSPENSFTFDGDS